MTVPLSRLIYARFREEPGERRVITLHRHNEFLVGMREIGLAANPDGAVTGLESSKGVYLARSIVGYTWYVGPLERPSPVHFGDAMQEIERFLWDEIDRQEADEAELPFLIGAEQGAVMALAMAGAVPDLLSGVVAIDPMLPVVPGWEPPLAPLEGLPMLLAAPRSGEGVSGSVLAGDELSGTLEQWGASVDVIEDAAELGSPAKSGEIAAWLGRQPVRRRRA